MSVGFHAVSRAQVTDLDTVMIIGCGMIGMGAIVRSTLRGATVIAVDLDDEKLEIAKRVGAHNTINSMTENVHERLTKITEGFGPDVVIEAVEMCIRDRRNTGHQSSYKRKPICPDPISRL